MFYDIIAHRILALLTAVCLCNTAYAGKEQTSRHHHLLPHQKNRKQNCFNSKNNDIPVILKEKDLYQAVCDNDVRTAASLLLSLRKTPINKRYGLWYDTLLHTAVKKKSRKLVALLLRRSDIDLSQKNISFCGPKTALDIALESGSHGMIKLLTRRKNFDPTYREQGESTINKLAQRNTVWAESLCQYVLKNQLRSTTPQASKEQLTCMICLQTPAEIIKAASAPVSTHNKPEQLMSITTCCHALLCSQDKKRWLDFSENKNCPNCRKPYDKKE
jgi:hypothetical protein